MNEKLEKLLDRCNEMDITEQLNWLGDASMSYQAKLEYAKLHAELARLQRTKRTLKQTAQLFHGTGLAYHHSIHDAGDFTDCNNGYCMEAAAALGKS